MPRRKGPAAPAAGSTAKRRHLDLADRGAMFVTFSVSVQRPFGRSA
jgi:hypothetical protein